MEVVEATAAAQHLAKPLLDERGHRFPSPVGQGHPSFRGVACTAAFSSLFALGRGRGGHRRSARDHTVGPCWRNSSTHAPIVWASRSSASATWVADHPRARARAHASVPVPEVWRHDTSAPAPLGVQLPMSDVVSILFIAPPNLVFSLTVYHPALRFSPWHQFNLHSAEHGVARLEARRLASDRLDHGRPGPAREYSPLACAGPR